MIASPDGGDNHHIEVLAELSSKLIEEGFIEAFLNTKNSEQALELLLKKSAPTPLANQAESKGLIIGVTIARQVLLTLTLRLKHWKKARRLWVLRSKWKPMARLG